MSSEGYGFQVGNASWTMTSEGYLLLGCRDGGWDGCQDDYGPIDDVVDGGMTREFGGGEESKLTGPAHLLLELLEGLLLAVGVDVACTRSRRRRSLELPDPASVALALVDASLSVDPFFRFLYYGLLLSSITL